MTGSPDIIPGVEGGKATLGEKTTERRRALDTFEAPAHIRNNTYTSDEVTANCPITGQPDFYTVDITVRQAPRLIESKSLKLYLQSFRDEGMFCEAFANRICEDVHDATGAPSVTVSVTQKPRGGVAIDATAEIERYR